MEGHGRHCKSLEYGLYEVIGYRDVYHAAGPASATELVVNGTSWNIFSDDWHRFSGRVEDSWEVLESLPKATEFSAQTLPHSGKRSAAPMSQGRPWSVPRRNYP